MLGLPHRRFPIVAQLLLTAMVAPFLVPLVVLVYSSLQGEGLQNYLTVARQSNLARYVFNSVVVSGGTVALVYACTMSAGYALAKLNLRGKQLILNAFLLGLLLPVISLLVPLFTTVQSLGLYNNSLSVILPLTAFAIPFTLLLTRGFVAGIPDELLDAAHVDGCGSFATLVRIVIPLSKPIAAVVVLWSFIASWNEFLLPLVFLRQDDQQLVTQVPQAFTGLYHQDQPKVFAASVLVSLPIVIAYLALQPLFERGLTAGAIK